MEAGVAGKRSVDVKYDVTVRRGLGYKLGTDLTTGAGTVSDRDLLSQELAQPGRHDTGQGIGPAALVFHPRS